MAGVRPLRQPGSSDVPRRTEQPVDGNSRFCCRNGWRICRCLCLGHLISLADEWSSVNARLKQASQSSDEFSSSQKVLMDISQRTGTAFSDNAALFARSAASMREYGYSAGDVLKVTEAISTGLKISGASTAEAGSVITQFSRALAQGVLRVRNLIRSMKAETGSYVHWLRVWAWPVKTLRRWRTTAN